MRIILFTHPSFSASVSMPRFTDMIASGMRARGHEVEVWAPQPKAWGIAPCGSLKKWFGYIDQFVLFPRWAKKRIARLPPKTLFVFTDHALGPWVPLVAGRSHVIHCHDFLAQRSARGDFPEHRTGFSGRLYQSYIRRGYRTGTAFISISKATQQDLHEFLGRTPAVSKVVYNGYNAEYRKIPPADAAVLSKDLREALAAGFVLNVGGNQWYKNRLGVVATYQRYAASVDNPKPLVLVGPKPSGKLQAAIDGLAPNSRVIVQSDIPFERLRALYNLASFFFFPSLEEGFGWPIAEAMACGCPVLTTDKAPMTEVGGEAVSLLPRMPGNPTELENWTELAVAKWQELFQMTEEARQSRMEAGLLRAGRFDAERTLDQYEAIYREIVNTE